MNPSFLRIFSRQHSPQPDSRVTTALTDLDVVRRALRACLSDGDGALVERLRQRIDAARTHRDLWMQRAPVYQAISLQHSQATAQQRLEALQPLFAGWVDLRGAMGRTDHSGRNRLAGGRAVPTAPPRQARSAVTSTRA